ncbi:MAG: cation diffusion facilitator family transporter [Candidatus Omnitrophota bacterium]
MSQNGYFKEVKRVLWVVLALNWLVAALKLVFGYLVKSNSMIADGFHSFSDGSSNIIGLIGIRAASQPEDKLHPYGHKKFETFSAIGIAMLLFLICFNILHESISRLKNPIIPEINLGSFMVMFVTLFINIFVMRYERNKGQAIKSDILCSDAMHTRSDILTSISVIIAFAAIKLGYPIMDIVVALIISIFIGKSAVDILKSSSQVLCDKAPVDDEIIHNIVMDIEGVRSCHKIRTRGRQDDIHIDLHVQVRPDMHVDRAHKISYKIEEELKNKIPGTTDVVIHIEPL